MGWKEVDEALNKYIESLVACKVAAKLAEYHAMETHKLADESLYWANKFRKKGLLFRKDEEV